jgi:hypothetical protein
MPYIKVTDEHGRRRRHQLLPKGATPESSGELNYAFTMLALQYLGGHGLSYDTLNTISGAFTEALAEFRRRVVVPYEDSKIAANGDVYGVHDYGRICTHVHNVVEPGTTAVAKTSPPVVIFDKKREATHEPKSAT